jgi:hypothetical protein
MVTPAGKWRMAFLKSLDEIKSGLSSGSGGEAQ